MWRRILWLPFENKIPAAKRDRTLQAELTDVSVTGAAVLAWIVAGCAEWYQQGLQVPQVVERGTRSYQPNGVCILHSSAFTTVADLRTAYASCVHETSERVLLGRAEVFAVLQDIG